MTDYHSTPRDRLPTTSRWHTQTANAAKRPNSPYDCALNRYRQSHIQMPDEHHVHITLSIHWRLWFVISYKPNRQRGGRLITPLIRRT